jgi:prephenate dehydrogenase/chorismate mutase
MRDLTRSVLDLTSARQNLAQLIAQVKQSSGAEVENHSVEEKLISEMVQYAKSIGLDEDLAKGIVSELIEYSKMAQRKKIYLDSIKEHLRSSNIRNVSIIGAGRMGGWFANYFIETDVNVLLFDANSRLSREKARKLGCGYAKTFEEAAQSDLAVVAVTIKATPNEIRKLARYRKENPGSTIRVLEISSIKSGLEKAGFTRSKLPANVRLYSIHPLFGATANPFAVNSMIQIGNESDFVRGIFPHYKIFRMSARAHDRLMSTILTIPHAHALSFANSVSSRKNTIPDDIGSSSFDHLLDLSRKTLKENADVYYEIQATNPYADKALSEVISSVSKLRSLLRDKSAFRKFFAETGRDIN